MKSDTRLRRVVPTARIRGGRIDAGLSRFRFPVVTLMAFAISALVTGAAFVTAADLVAVALPTLLVGWVVAVGVAFALPLLVVRAVVALLERYQ